MVTGHVVRSYTAVRRCTDDGFCGGGFHPAPAVWRIRLYTTSLRLHEVVGGCALGGAYKLRHCDLMPRTACEYEDARHAMWLLGSRYQALDPAPRPWERWT